MSRLLRLPLLCLLCAGSRAVEPDRVAAAGAAPPPPDFHAFLAEAARQAVELEILVARNFPADDRAPTRIFRSEHREDIDRLAGWLAGCDEPPLQDQEAVVVLSPFPPPEFRYLIILKADQRPDPTLVVWLYSHELLQGLPAPWFHQTRMHREAGFALWDFLRREHAFTAGAPPPDPGGRL